MRRPDSDAGTGSSVELAAVQSQTRAAQHELDELLAHIASARHEFAGDSAVQAVNEQLICSALQAQLAADTCHESLRDAARQAERDPLTGLPNRALLLDRLVHALAQVRRKSERLALLFLDLDGFKQVNDLHGHATGDAVLQQVASRLRHAVREVDTVSRHGGDEFLVLLTDFDSTAGVVAVADKLLAAFEPPIEVGERKVALRLSIGISFYPDDGEVAGDLIECADSAMYLAKSAGGHCAALAGAVVAHAGTGAAAPSTAGKALDERQALLLEANERLLLAALDSRQSQDAAETAHRLQRENLAVVAHELRGPLSPLRMAAAMLPRLPPAQLPQVQAIIERGVTQLNRLVGDLLDLSRVHTGKLRLERQPIDLIEVLEQAADAARPVMEARGHAFDVAPGGEPLPILGDAVRLDQVFRNLLDNAAKYTPKGGRVRLEARVRCGLAEVTVSDTGIGIALTSLQAVFEPFAQHEHAISFDGAGLGIGLTVVRELVEGHGGSVVACSDGLGKGSCFVVTLPLMEPAAVAPGPSR